MTNEQSEQINEIAGALSKAQAEILDAIKGAKNPFIGNKYASLTDVSNACRIQLTNQDLFITQTCPPPAEIPPGMITIITTLRHKSGQWIRGYLTMPIVKKGKGEAEGHASQDPQAFGAIMTYCRRYALAAMAWVCPEEYDTDAEVHKPAAKPSAKAPERPATATPPYQAGPADMPEPPAGEEPPPPEDDGRDVDPAAAPPFKITPTEVQMFQDARELAFPEDGKGRPKYRAWLFKLTGKSSMKALNAAEFMRAYAALLKLAPMPAEPSAPAPPDGPDERTRIKAAIQEWIDAPGGKDKMDRVRTMLKLGAKSLDLMTLAELRAVLAELRKMK